MTNALLDPRTAGSLPKIRLFGFEHVDERVAAAQADAFVYRLALTWHGQIVRLHRLSCSNVCCGDELCRRGSQRIESSLPKRPLIGIAGERVFSNVRDFGSSSVMGNFGCRLVREEYSRQRAKKQTKTRRARNGKES